MWISGFLEALKGAAPEDASFGYMLSRIYQIRSRSKPASTTCTACESQFETPSSRDSRRRTATGRGGGYVSKTVGFTGEDLERIEARIGRSACLGPFLLRRQHGHSRIPTEKQYEWSFPAARLPELCTLEAEAVRKASHDERPSEGSRNVANARDQVERQQSTSTSFFFATRGYHLFPPFSARI